VPPFNCYVEFNGWPAGVFNPFGGIIAAGELANRPRLRPSSRADRAPMRWSSEAARVHCPQDPRNRLGVMAACSAWPGARCSCMAARFPPRPLSSGPAANWCGANGAEVTSAGRRDAP